MKGIFTKFKPYSVRHLLLCVGIIFLGGGQTWSNTPGSLKETLMMGTVDLTVSSNASSEQNPTSITVTAVSSEAVVGNQTVSVLVSGTGITSGDYYLTNTVITILNGQTSGSVTFVVADDAITEGPETAVLALSNPSAGIVLGNSITQNIAITDNACSFLKFLSNATSVNGAEIPAFDPGSKRLYSVAGSVIEVFTVSNTGALSLVGSLPVGFSAGAGINVLPNSVAVKNGIVAASYALVNSTTNAQQPGRVSFYEAATGTLLNSVTVGFLPDMVVFSPDGKKVLTANEGEPNSYNQPTSFDPEGSISVIDISGGVTAATVQTLGFTSFNGQIATLRAAGVRIYGPNATVAQDLEPEYITITPNGQTAWVTLQENNAIAIIDLLQMSITAIRPLGLKDHNATGNGIDASDRDLTSSTGRINIQNWPVFGMYQPDAVTNYSVGGQTYFVTANEGDARDYTGFSEEVRVGAGAYVLDPVVFPNAATLKQNANLGRLQLTSATGNLDGDSEFEQIHALGARSFSVWDAAGNLVFDSKDQFEQITALRGPSVFNSDGTTATFDTRSDNKGPEPEGLVIGTINGVPYAFIGLERTGDIMVYNISNPANPTFIQWINTPTSLGLEGLEFVPSNLSPTGTALLLTTSEVSRTLTVYEIGFPDVKIAAIENTGDFPNDGTICEGTSVTLVASGGTSFLWSTGANTASITVTTSGTYSVTVSNASGCTGTSSKTVEVISTSNQLNCNDFVQISLDEDCNVVVDADMILEGTYACYGGYQVIITGPNGVPNYGNTLTAANIGQTLTVTVKHLINGNSCWGLIKVEDKLPPTLTCNNFSVSCAETNLAPAFLNGTLGITAAWPSATGDCTSLNRTFNDVLTNLDCPPSPTAPSVTGYITRTWFVSDASGNTATCSQRIDLVGARIFDVVFPQDAIVQCSSNGSTAPSATGVPTVVFNYPAGPKSYPIWPQAAHCELSATYADQVLPVCDGTYKILRTWTAYDWCLPTSPFPPTSNPQYYVQLVKVVDETGPSIEAIDDVVASTNANTCCANVDLPNVIVGDACSRIASAVATIYGYDQYTGDLIGTFTVNGTLTTFPGNNLWTPDTLATFGFTPCLPIGNHEVIYTITDDCGNASTYEFELTVEDQTPPQVAADEWTQISIGVDGMAFINAETFDDGSYDNCGPVYFKVRRMDNNPCQITDRFHPQVKFCCEDIGDTIMVIFRVYDVDPGAGTTGLEEFEGHYSDVMVQVLVEDKLKPVCVAPANVTVSCEAFDPSLWAYGQATATDNCSNPTITGTVVYTQFDSLCNKGTITRRWTAVDAGGNTSQCTQRIIVTYNQNYWVKFPADRLVSTCDGTTAYGAPEFYGEDCELLATSYTDEFFTVIPDACYKIERTWRVINWCTYNPNNSTCQFVPNPNPNNTTNHPTNLPGVTVSPLGTTVPGWAPTVVRINPSDPQPTNYSTFWNKETNCYTYKQIIKVFDTQDPTVSPAPTEFCDLSTNDGQFYNAMQYWDAGIASHDLCEGDANIELTATDACSGASLNFRYLLFLDLDGNGSMETVVNSVAPLAYNTLFYDNATAVNYVGGTPWNFDFRPVPNDRKWAFGLQVDNANGNSRTARVRWVNQVGQNAVPQLPYGNHKIKWFVEDGCGNETVYEHAIVVKDCKKPTVVCLNGFSINLMNSTPAMVQLWASDFLQYTEDNCTPANLIKIGIRRVGQADGQGNTTGFPKNANGTPQTGVTFTCADLGTQLVELWGLDVAGNADYCETYVLIQDNAGVCGTNADIAGALKNEGAQGVEDANVELDGSANGVPVFDEVFSQVTGDYAFSNALPYAGNATVTPTMEIDPLNGVNTWDLILISRHILGLEPLNTPYKLIAADANKSGTVTTFDIVELRKLILGTYQQLPNNSSWRFVDKSQVFTNPANPFADVIRENIQIANIQTNVSNGDFVAAKIGDVDGTATPNNLVASDDRTAGTLLFDIQDRAVKAGETFTVNFKAADKAAGYQFTMNTTNLEVVDILPGEKMTTENFAVFADAITTSADDTNGEFAVTFRATAEGQLSNMLAVSSRITKAVAFDGTSKLNVAFRFNNGGNSTIAGVGFELYQNAPNPFVNKTFVGFHLPEATSATLSVYDETGRVLYTTTGDFGKGYNAISLDRTTLNANGVLYYKLETTTDSATKKMIQTSK